MPLLHSPLRVVSRSVSTASTDPTLFRVSGVDTLFCAHVSVDGTVFVQQIKEGALAELHCVCVIDWPHDVSTGPRDLSSKPEARPGRRAPAGPKHAQVAWLGSSQHILALAAGPSLFLTSISPAIAHIQDPARDPPPSSYYPFLTYEAPASILALCGTPTLDTLYLLTAGRHITRLVIHSASAGSSAQLPQAGPTGAGAVAAWSQTLPLQQHLVVADPGSPHLCATASAVEPAIAVWRSERSAAFKLPILEWVRTPCAAASLSFRPQCASDDASLPSTLMCLGMDGCVRVWVDTDACACLPPGIRPGRNAPRHCMTLSQVLSPPDLHSWPSRNIAASWAQELQAPGPAQAPCTSQQRGLSWITMLVSRGGDADDDGMVLDRGIEREPVAADELWIWTLDLSLTRRHAGGDSAMWMGGVQQVPRCKAVMWGADKGSLFWLDPSLLFEDSSAQAQRPPGSVSWDWPRSTGRGSSGGTCLRQETSVSLREGAPVLSVGHVAFNRARRHAEIRVAMVDLVDVSDGGGVLDPRLEGPAPQSVALHSVAARQVAPETPSIVQLAVHDTLPLAVTLDDAGRVSPWLTDPLEVCAELQPTLAGLPTALALAFCPANASPAPTTAPHLIVLTPKSLMLLTLMATQLDLGPIALVRSLVAEEPVSSPLPDDFQPPERCDAGLVATVPRARRCLHVTCVASSDGERRTALARIDFDETNDASSKVSWLSASEQCARCDVLQAADGRDRILTVGLSFAAAKIWLGVFAASTDGLALVASTDDGDEARPSSDSGHSHFAAVHANVDCGVAASLTCADRDSDESVLTFWHVDFVSGRVVCTQSERDDEELCAVHVVGLPANGAVVAVAQHGSVKLWAQNGQRWLPISQTAVPGNVHTIAYSQDFLFVASRTQIVAYNPTAVQPLLLGSHSSDAASTRPGVHLAVTAAVLSAAAPLWHPLCIAALVLRGLYAQAAAVLRALAAALRSQRPSPVAGDIIASIVSAEAPVSTLIEAFAAVLEVAKAHHKAHGRYPRAIRSDSFPELSHLTPSQPDNRLSTGQFKAETFTKSPLASSTSAATRGPHSATSAAAPAQQHAGVDSGLLPMGAFAAMQATPAPASSQAGPPDSLATGMLDMSAFGAGAGASKPAQATPAPQAAGGPPRDSLATGMLDMSAFGMGGVATAAPRPSASTGSSVPDASSSQTASTPQDGLATGMLDMSAFGMGGNMAPAPPPAPAARPAVPASSSSQQDSMATGMLDMSAFGMGCGAPPAKPAAVNTTASSTASTSAQPQQANASQQATETQRSALESGLLDMSAFSGSTGQRAPSSNAPPAADPLASGMIDLAAFGMASTAAAPPVRQQATQPQPQSGDSSTAASPPALAVATRRAGPASEALERTAPSTEAASLAAAGDALAHITAAPHCGAQDAALSDHDFEAFKSLMEASKKDSAAISSVFGITPADGYLLLRLSRAVSGSAPEASVVRAQVTSLDPPGRRLVSAACVGSAALEASWDIAEAAVRDGAEGAASPTGQRPKKHAMSASALALLQKLGSSGAVSSMQRVTSHRGASTKSLASSDGLESPQHVVPRQPPAEQPQRHSLWRSLHLLPTLRHSTLHWAFDCSSPGLLLDATMSVLPVLDRSPEAAEAGSAATSKAFSAALRSSAAAPNAWTWENFRRAGAGLWLREPTDVLRAIDRIAKATFAARRDALSVATWYCAQGKFSLLAGLLRTSGETKIATFLSRDFSSEANRAAASKNAHALLSQHRPSLAVAFFLLAHDYEAVVDTCLNYLHDAQLALVLSRLLDASGTMRVTHGTAPAFTERTTKRLVTLAKEQEETVLFALMQRLQGRPVFLDSALLDGLCASHNAAASAGDHATATSDADDKLAALLGMQAADWVAYSALRAAAVSDKSAAASCATLAVAPDDFALRLLRALTAAAHGVAAAGAAVSATSLARTAAALAAAWQRRDTRDRAALQRLQPGAAQGTLERFCTSAALSMQAEHFSLTAVSGSAAPDAAALGSSAQALGRRSALAAASAPSVLSALVGSDEDAACLARSAMLPEVGRVQACFAALAAAPVPPTQLAAEAVSPSRAGVAHGPAGTAHPREEKAAVGGDPTLPLNAAAIRMIMTCDEKDGQAVCCQRQAAYGEGWDVVVATRRKGLAFTSVYGRARSSSGPRHRLFNHLREQVVEEWHGEPSLRSRKIEVSPAAAATASAQVAQRVALVRPEAATCTSQALAAHPLNSTFLSGSAPGYVHLWHLDTGTLKATYAPLPYTRHMASTTPASVPQPSQVAHWSYAADVAFCASGDRFAALGKGGWLCFWRHDARWADTVYGRMGCCDWSHHVLDRAGQSVAFVGASSSVVLAAGVGSGTHGHAAVWDTLAPLASACVGSLPIPRPASAAAVADDGVTVLVTDKHGDVAAYDLRRLQSSAGGSSLTAVSSSSKHRAAAWVAERAHATGATCVALSGSASSSSAAATPGLAATGGAGGDVLIWDIQTGKKLQTLEQMHWIASRGLFGLSKEEKLACKVKGLAFHPQGLLSVGQNERVVLTPYVQR